MEIDRQTIVTPSPQEGEITRIAKGIDPIWKVAGAIAGFIAVVYYGSEVVLKVKDNATRLNAIEEQIKRQYNTHNTDIDKLKEDTDEELDVLEEELDKIKERVFTHDAYEQGIKDAKK